MDDFFSFSDELARKQLHTTAGCEGQKSALSFLTAYKSHMAILSKTSLFSAKKKKTF